MKVNEVFIYPIKSCRGIKVPRAKITARGLENDRIFAIVKGSSMEHISLRCTPKMATIVPEFSSDGSSLTLTASDVDDLSISLAEPQSTLLQMKVWDDCIDAREVSSDASKWVCDALGVPGLMLLRISDKFTRKLGAEFSSQGHTGLADEAPVMLASTASLRMLNRRLSEPVSMLNFRPNIVVSGCAGFAEDKFKTVTIGGSQKEDVSGVDSGVVLTAAKLTSRCSLPNTHPILGVRDNNLSVTKALREFRTGTHLDLGVDLADSVFFGIQLDNAGCEGADVCIGDAITYSH